MAKSFVSVLIGAALMDGKIKSLDELVGNYIPHFKETANAKLTIRQVLMMSTSASSARDVISIPRCKTLPSMISASTRFFAQPRLIMPTLVLILRKRRGLLDSYVGVGLGQRFAIFPDLDCFAVQDPDRDMLAAEFDNAIGRRNPALVGRRRRSIIHNYFDVGFS